jgi:hypothetical protein
VTYDELLPLFAEVAIAITGFSGVVSVFGQNKDSWSPADIIRLISLLTASLSAFIFCLVALTLSASGVSEELIWRIVSALVAAERLSWLLRFSRGRAAFVARGTIVFFYLFSVGNIAAMLLSAANALFVASLWPFVAAVVWYLSESSWVFVRLVLFPIRGIEN